MKNGANCRRGFVPSVLSPFERSKPSSYKCCKGFTSSKKKRYLIVSMCVSIHLLLKAIQIAQASATQKNGVARG